MNWRPKLLVNDLHIGVQRTGGTTPHSAAKLRADLLGRFRALLMQHLDKDVVINGDLFDTFAVSLQDLLGAYSVLCEWLDKTEYAQKLFLGRGNHDIAKDSSKLSSFDFLCALLKARYNGRVFAVTEPQLIEHGVYMVPHLPNQDLFNLEIEQGGASKMEHGLILFHANFDNNFAMKADHSLNVSREQAAKLIERGNCLLFGHEHQQKWAMAESVLVTGNQFPTSVADCMHNPDDTKYAHLLAFGEANDIEVQRIVTWKAPGSFYEIPWHQIMVWAQEGNVEFVRVTGTATAEQAQEVIAAIASLRKFSMAYVVSNAVQIEGLAEQTELSISAEEVKSFDVLGYLLEQLDPAQAECVKGLLAKRDALKEAA